MADLASVLNKTDAGAIGSPRKFRTAESLLAANFPDRDEREVRMVNEEGIAFLSDRVTTVIEKQLEPLCKVPHLFPAQSDMARDVKVIKSMVIRGLKKNINLVRPYDVIKQARQATAVLTISKLLLESQEELLSAAQIKRYASAAATLEKEWGMRELAIRLRLASRSPWLRRKAERVEDQLFIRWFENFGSPQKVHDELVEATTAYEAPDDDAIVKEIVEEFKKFRLTLAFAGVIEKAGRAANK